MPAMPRAVIYPSAPAQDSTDNDADESFHHQDDMIMDAHRFIADPMTTTDDVVALLNARKRRRRTLAKERQVLEDAFVQCATPDRTERARLAREIGWSDKAVTVWFQNRRQKERKQAATTTPITMRPPSPAPSAASSSSSSSPPSRARTASLASSTCASPPTPTPIPIPSLPAATTPPLSPTPAARLWSIPTPVPVRIPPVATALRSLIRARAAMQAPRPAVVEHAVDPACPCYACSRALLLGGLGAMPAAPVEVEDTQVDRTCQAFAPLATLLAVCEVERERERVVARPSATATAC
ncbi:hypothetical protein AMAG_08574 [Allomyces macrogynus ATCC 38327]|uniref:Homeobox domain-containing protein n=1 Tax=Allomyces macrogynus (strain ATCC 38327) TaxID=578462 RepID=A0A0L0SLV0_ALLM3|nr:hypothetical protein AMAG_08574 [Allomyces macrogynus ATCC 38327]|eukprot:KNE63448.1 hypothetical protein AMAG_08574 [Allomyces macrogynus ATCC 38327]